MNPRGFVGAVRMTLVAALLASAVLRCADVRPRMLLLDAALSGADVVAVGERGTILRSADSARSWQRVAAPTRATLTAVAFAPGTGAAGWAVGHDALILGTLDGGRTWSRQYQGEDLQDSFLDVLAIDSQRVIAIGAYGLFLETDDGGKTWRRTKVIDDDRHLNRISRRPEGALFLVGERGTLLRSADRGRTWTTIAVPYDGSLYGVLAVPPRTLLVHGLEGSVFRSTDDGQTWTKLACPQSALLCTSIALSGDILIAGQTNTLFQPAASDALRPLRGVGLRASVAELVSLPNGDVLAVGEAGPQVLARNLLAGTP